VSLRALRILRVPRVAWTLGVIVAVYLSLGALFEHLTQVRGLITPGGAPNLDVVATGVAYLLARMVVRFGLPFVAALSAARWVANRVLDRVRARRQ
jgi:hypothetical protein